MLLRVIILRGMNCFCTGVSLICLMPAHCIPPIECLLLACLVCVVDTPTEGEGEYVDDIAGEEPGQPEPAGKPPLTPASLCILLHLCICFGYIHMHFRWYRSRLDAPTPLR